MFARAIGASARQRSAGRALVLLLGGVVACGRPYYAARADRLGAGADLPLPAGETPARPAADGGRDAAQLARKVVVDKEDRSTLVARDGSRCTTTERRAAAVREGEWIWCAWSAPRR